MIENEKKYKYLGMAEIIRDYLQSFIGTESIVRLTAKEARKLDGMDEFANNTCYNNVARAMEYVAENYVYGKQVPGTERGKGNSTYAFDYDLNRNDNVKSFVLSEIKNKMEYIEDMGCPHKQPSKLPQGYSAIYICV